MLEITTKARRLTSHTNEDKNSLKSYHF